MTQPHVPYVLGTHDDEAARLGLQHALWASHTFALWERAGVGPGMTVLDVGCGPGHAAFDLAELVGPTGRVVAIDESPRFIELLSGAASARGVGWIDARVGDVQRLDLPPASVDAAYERWVLCWISDPRAAVAGVARALRPGGVFAIQDYFNYRALTLALRSTTLDRVLAGVREAWAKRGGDEDLAARLPRMLAECGLAVEDVRTVARVARPGEPLWHWPDTFFRTFAPKLVGDGFLSRADLEAFLAEWDERCRDPHTFFFTPPVFEFVARKGR